MCCSGRRTSIEALPCNAGGSWAGRVPGSGPKSNFTLLCAPLGSTDLYSHFDRSLVKAKLGPVFGTRALNTCEKGHWWTPNKKTGTKPMVITRLFSHYREGVRMGNGPKGRRYGQWRRSGGGRQVPVAGRKIACGSLAGEVRYRHCRQVELSAGGSSRNVEDQYQLIAHRERAPGSPKTSRSR